MAGMKRFVTYIYAYEDKKKGSNAGFAKIEMRGDECRIEIHLRGVYTGRTTCKIYLVKEEGQELLGFPIGELRIMNGNGDFGTKMKSSQIGEPEDTIFDMQGLFLLGEDDRIFMSRWKEGGTIEICKEHFREWSAPEVQVVRPTDVSQTVEQSKTHSTFQYEAAEEEHVMATEIPMRNIFPRYDWKTVWDQLLLTRPQLAPFEEAGTVCVQIELKDLRELPKRYWYLGNNSFLLHGFFNYQYLVVGKMEDDRWFIGVPGIYQHQERVMAAIFGFPEFMATVTEETQQTDEKEPVNRFGVWYRYVEE